jgi:hypothetical protein
MRQLSMAEGNAQGAKYPMSECSMPEMRSMSGPTGAPLTNAAASGAHPSRDPIHSYQRRSMDCCSACRAVSREDFAFGSGWGGGLGLSFMVATFVEGCDESRRKGAAGPGGGRTKDSGRDRRPSRPGRLTNRCSTTEPKRSGPKKESCRTSLTPARCGGDPRGQRRTPRRGAGLLAADPAAATKD